MSALAGYVLQYEDLNNNTRWGRKGMKMSKQETTKVKAVPTAKTRRVYDKSRGEHYKDMVIMAFVAGVIAFVGGIVFANKQNAVVQQARAAAPTWSCAAEDEVVVMGGTCKHIDTLAPAALK